MKVFGHSTTNYDRTHRKSKPPFLSAATIRSHLDYFGSVHVAKNRTIAFRLHDVLEKRLSDEAAQRKQSVGEYARQIIIDHLAGGGPAQKGENALQLANDLVSRIEARLRVVAIELLINAGRAEPAEAIAWAEQHFPLDNGRDKK